MSDYLVNEELKSLKRDRELAEVQLNEAKKKIADEMLKSIDINCLNTNVPFRRKRTLHMRLAEFLYKIKFIFGIKNNEDR